MPSSLVIKDLRGAIVGPISLTVAAGACAAITGSSGAGKSLFLRMVADLDPNDGEVALGDIRRAAVPAPIWRAGAMHVAAEAGWWAERVDAHFPADTLADALDLAGRLGLSAEYLQREVRTLSTGERQRLALVRALARRPACLLLDEPTSALDPASIARAESLLREAMARGTILVLVSHDAGQAERLASARYVMQAGRLSPA